MSPTFSETLSPAEAWQPLPALAWNADAARHLLLRTGWTAGPEEVQRTLADGLELTLERLFAPTAPRFDMPHLVAQFEATTLAQQNEAARVAGDDRIRLQREQQERNRVGLQELSLAWLAHAARPEASALAKWVLFLSDVYVVSAEKVRNPAAIYRHFDTLAAHALGPAPALTKAVSRTAAMLFYLDLGQSQLRSPNENFPRELFELFLLGEGHYTEQDIKETARAFTGYRSRADGTFRFDARIHDAGEKTIFGETGRFTGDDVIDLAYRQPAAATFLPRELARFYLGEPLPSAAQFAALGERWRSQGFALRALVHDFFRSRFFFAPEFRGAHIKSPLQLYLGLVQDLALEVAPLPRLTLGPLRAMGQLPFHPPNVRGWIGGRQWINSSTLAARRQLIEQLFSAVDENSLNADESFELLAARSNGRTRFTVTDRQLEPLAHLAPSAAAAALTGRYLPAAAARAAEPLVAEFLGAADQNPSERLPQFRRAAIALLQSPAYQLC